MYGGNMTKSRPEDKTKLAGAISVIMPVYNGTEFITRSLPPLLAMQQRGEVLEVIVVDDRSTDASAATAGKLGARVISSGGRLGPGAARNKAADIAQGDILWFVDADVVVHEDAAPIIQSGFNEPAVFAVFGSYDDRPPAQNFFSQYKNLVHHYYHQRANEDAQTFWSGCGAVRRDIFLAQGGFDVDRFKYPSIEDIELGHRLLQAGGRLRLIKNLQCTHLKVWRFGNLIHTDVFRRAIPWSKLILTGSGIPNDLNVSTLERMRAVVAGLLFLALSMFLLGLVGPGWFLLALLAVACANSEILAFFYRKKGPLFAFMGLMFHQLYYLYSGLAFVWVMFELAWGKLAGKQSIPARSVNK
jgi:glycosyltransferase involved in cell wall biosynthesis